MLATSIMRLGCSLGCEPAQPVDNPAFAWIETVPPVVGHRKEHAVPALLICRELADDIGLPTHGSLERSHGGRGNRSVSWCRPSAWTLLRSSVHLTN